uniref:Saposin B-type domain-containing protein n=1 Tax=Steinernema glaseri TaxID=37863 RepID=A0A1I7ZJ91_9BILA
MPKCTSPLADMKLIFTLLAFFALACFANATALRKHPLASDADIWKTVKCDACKVLDKAILGLENVAEEALKTFLDGECNKVHNSNGKYWCLSFVDDVVGFVEKFGNRLDENELCHNLIKAC